MGKEELPVGSPGLSSEHMMCYHGAMISLDKNFLKVILIFTIFLVVILSVLMGNAMAGTMTALGLSMMVTGGVALTHELAHLHDDVIDPH